jgi:hypothetical protein
MVRDELIEGRHFRKSKDVEGRNREREEERMGQEEQRMTERKTRSRDYVTTLDYFPSLQ